MKHNRRWCKRLNNVSTKLDEAHPPKGKTTMMNNYMRYEDEDAQRRQTTDVERRHDQQDRLARARKEQWVRAQDRRLAADVARRRRAEDEQRRFHA
jgi:hypothetical protein